MHTLTLFGLRSCPPVGTRQSNGICTSGGREVACPVPPPVPPPRRLDHARQTNARHGSTGTYFTAPLAQTPPLCLSSAASALCLSCTGKPQRSIGDASSKHQAALAAPTFQEAPGRGGARLVWRHTTTAHPLRELRVLLRNTHTHTLTPLSSLCPCPAPGACLPPALLPPLQSRVVLALLTSFCPPRPCHRLSDRTRVHSSRANPRRAEHKSGASDRRRTAFPLRAGRHPEERVDRSDYREVPIQSGDWRLTVASRPVVGKAR